MFGGPEVFVLFICLLFWEQQGVMRAISKLLAAVSLRDLPNGTLRGAPQRAC